MKNKKFLVLISFLSLAMVLLITCTKSEVVTIVEDEPITISISVDGYSSSEERVY
jgi:hypothetical protein